MNEGIGRKRERWEGEGEVGRRDERKEGVAAKEEEGLREGG